MSNLQQPPSSTDVRNALKADGVHISETASEIVAERIKSVIAQGGAYMLHRLSEGRGVNLTLMSATNEIIDMSRFFVLGAKDKRWLLPSYAWLEELTTPYRKSFPIAMTVELRSMIQQHLQNGGSWEAKLCNGYVEIVCYNMFGQTVMSLTIRE